MVDSVRQWMPPCRLGRLRDSVVRRYRIHLSILRGLTPVGFFVCPKVIVTD